MILVDTDVLVWALRGSRPAQDWIREAREAGPLLASVVTVAELTGGMRSAERHQVWNLLAALRAQPVTEVIARRAGEFRREWRSSHGSIGTSDDLIAATADVLGVELATLNVGHFPMFEDLRPPFRP
ncbi:MAG: type II toxin-antitoxin system VapC family toxin [Marmoricola sp.]